MRILLINPPSSFAFRNITGFCVPPLGLAYLAAVLEKHGYDVKIIDGVTENLTYREISKIISKYCPDLVGITATTPTIYDAYIVARIAKHHGVKVVIGGPHATFLDTDVLKECPYIDFVVRGEGELTLLELVKALEKRKPLSHVLGLTWRDRDGRIKRNSRRPYILNLDDLPMPAYHLLPMDKYQVGEIRYATIMTSRGCPFKCTFCASSRLFGKRYRWHSAERVLDEIEVLVNKYKVKSIEIIDDTFTLNRKRAIKIAKGILKRGLDIIWSCSSRVDTIDKELAEILKKSGCSVIYLGIESGSQRILNKYKKGVTIDQITRAVKILKEAKLEILGSFILGAPDETIDEARKTLSFSLKLDLDYAQYSILTPYPGTEIYEKAEKKGLLLTKNWRLYDALHPVLKTLIPPRKLRSLVRKAYLIFYSRITYIFNQLKKGHAFLVNKIIKNVIRYILSKISRKNEITSSYQ